MPELKLENSLVDGRYEVRERLSRGSYAEIFVACDREANGREVVIKALNTSLQGTPDADLERTLVENFQNEAIALDTVRHPNVILRWGHGTAADLRGVPFHYLVLEYMPGGDLLKLCRERPNNALPFEVALHFFEQACKALAFAHSKGIIHRDLKPNNLLLSADRRILKIADFGVAKITTGEDTEVTRVGADIYAPPEHNPYEESGQSDPLTASADIYSLAKSLYTVVCGRPPSQFKCDPIIFLPNEIMRERWGEPLLGVLRRATEDEVSKRHVAVVDFWNDLAQIAEIAQNESTDEETIVKPRLKFTPGEMPKSPLKPDFEPALASLGSQASFASATPFKSLPEPEILVAVVEKPQAERQDARSPKFYLDLQPPEPVPPVQEQGRAAPTAKMSGPKPAVRPERSQSRAETKPIEQTVADRFSETLRRRIFMLLLALAFIGALVSTYNFVSKGETLIGFGPPTKIEVSAINLYVRAGPTTRDAPLGIIPKGSRHRVLARANQDWLQIEVSEWNETKPHVTDQNQGWVYGNLDGNPPNVRVVSRRLW